MSSLKIQGNAANTGVQTLQSANISTTITQTLPVTDAVTLGYLNAPPVGTKTASYTLATTDVGKYVQVGTSGSIVVPNSTFSEGDLISIYNNTTGNVAITLNTTSAYVAGTNTNLGTANLTTRGVATVLFFSSTGCVLTGNASA
jgi:hypothetical protein